MGVLGVLGVKGVIGEGDCETLTARRARSPPAGSGCASADKPSGTTSTAPPTANRVSVRNAHSVLWSWL